MLPTPLNRWAQLLAGTAVALVLGFGLGHHQKTLEDAQAALSGAKKTVAVVTRQAAVNSTVDQHLNTAVASTQAHTITLVRRIPEYVTRQADARCVVPNGAVSLLDNAAHDTVPSAPVSLPDADSGVAISEVIQDDVVNAGSYHELAERLHAWDEWWDKHAKP